MPTQRMPRAVAELRGVKRSRINYDEPQPAALEPTPPGDRDEPWLELWRQRLADLRSLGLGPYRVDQAAIIGWVDAERWYLRLAEIMARSPVVVRATDGSAVANPLERSARAAAEELRRWSARFGGSPSDRSNIRTRLSGVVASATVDRSDRLFSKPGG